MHAGPLGWTFLRTAGVAIDQVYFLIVAVGLPRPTSRLLVFIWRCWNSPEAEPVRQIFFAPAAVVFHSVERAKGRVVEYGPICFDEAVFEVLFKRPTRGGFELGQPFGWNLWWRRFGHASEYNRFKGEIWAPTAGGEGLCRFQEQSGLLPPFELAIGLHGYRAALEEGLEDVGGQVGVVYEEADGWHAGGVDV
jgi:hypothetical protein